MAKVTAESNNAIKTKTKITILLTNEFMGLPKIKKRDFSRLYNTNTSQKVNTKFLCQKNVNY